MYWWELFASIEMFMRCPNGPIAWQGAPETRQRYRGSPLVTPPSPERKREYHEGALARIGGRTYDGAIKYAGVDYGTGPDRTVVTAVERTATGTYTIVMDEAASWDELALAAQVRAQTTTHSEPPVEPRKNRKQRRTAAALARRAGEARGWHATRA